MTTKMTHKDYFNRLSAIVTLSAENGLVSATESANLTAFINGRIEAIVKKNGAERKPTKTQQANIVLAETILDVMEENTLYTVSQILKMLDDVGGVEIPHDKGLLGHSDADVLTHAIMDALLSSASLRDIGYHFSDKDAQYKDISSMVLLERVMEMLKEKGVKPLHVSAVIMAEKPKLLNYIPSIQQNLAKALNLPIEKVGITATTLEGIGIVGREEGIASNAYVLCSKEGDL